MITTVGHCIKEPSDYMSLVLYQNIKNLVVVGGSKELCDQNSIQVINVIINSRRQVQFS